MVQRARGVRELHSAGPKRYTVLGEGIIARNVFTDIGRHKSAKETSQVFGGENPVCHKMQTSNICRYDRDTGGHRSRRMFEIEEIDERRHYTNWETRDKFLEPHTSSNCVIMG